MLSDVTPYKEQTFYQSSEFPLTNGGMLASCETILKFWCVGLLDGGIPASGAGLTGLPLTRPILGSVNFFSFFGQIVYPWNK